MDIPRRRLGKTGVDVTILGLGGEGVLRTFGQEKDAYRLINRALDLGITYCESARAYSGSESYYGLALKERREEIFLASKSHARDKKGAWAHLHETLRNMKTERLDLWQVHDVRTAEEIEEIFGRGGAIEAFAEARERGLVRFIGVTGHHDPLIIRRCIEMFDFDTVLLPVNPAEPHHRSFIEEVIPLAVDRGHGDRRDEGLLPGNGQPDRPRKTRPVLPLFPLASCDHRGYRLRYDRAARRERPLRFIVHSPDRR